MAYTRTEAAVVCPFFREAEGKSIKCEGGVVKTCETVTRFKTSADRERYMRDRCKHAFGICPLAVGISGLYGYEIPKDRECKEQRE